MAKKKKRRMKKAARYAAYGVIVVSLIVAAVSGYLLWAGLHENNVGNSLYDKFRENVRQQDTEDDEKEQVVDFEQLAKINSDVYGWIHLEDSNIDYPFVLAADNEYYLTHTFDGSNNRYGTVFIDARAPEPFVDTNTVLYGHHMKDGAMFADIENYKDPEYYKTHKVIEITTLDGKWYMYPVAGRTISGSADYVQFNFADEADLNGYLSIFTGSSTFKSDEKILPGNKMMLLSTCSYDFNDARYVLIGKLVKKVSLQ